MILKKNKKYDYKEKHKYQQIKESHNPHKQGAHQEIYGLKTKKKNIRDGK